MTYQLDSIPTERTCWVDPLSGDDVTGAKGSQKHQFATIAAALAACVSGDCCMVRPGTYVESGLTVPAGVALRGQAGWQVTRVGDPTSLVNIITLNDDSQVWGLAIDCPAAAGTAGIVYSGGPGTTASIYNVQLHGDGALGQAEGIYKTGAGKIIGSEIRVDTGGLRSCLLVDSGVLALESIHVPPSAGTIEAVARNELTGRFQLADFNVGSPTATDAVYCDGTSTTLIFGSTRSTAPTLFTSRRTASHSLC